MDQRSVFFDEWLRSLREQYKHVVRSNDAVTLPTLTAVMHNVGFSEDELKQLRLEATMHVDDVSDDFLPDLDIVNAPGTAQPHPAECICPQCMNVDDGAHDAEGQPIPAEPPDDSNRVYPAAEINSIEPNEESDPVTFEDGLALKAEALEDGETAADTDDTDQSDDAEFDPDAPQQMSMF
ncbi:MAG: hypothetical protein OXG78_16100 [Chloroflexi bacterium]|nr:hypothetical protein [Chloroflexota bacterium]